MRARGFTLIEVVVTVAIVSILATAVFPMAELAVRRTKEEQLRDSLRSIRSAIDAYKEASQQGQIEMKVDQTGYPPTLDVLYQGVKDVSSADGRVIYFLRRLPRDPFFPDSKRTAADTWGLRSYESPPEQPEPGKDVFDVYSLSTREGLNGIPYSKW